MNSIRFFHFHSYHFKRCWVNEVGLQDYRNGLDFLFSQGILQIIIIFTISIRTVIPIVLHLSILFLSTIFLPVPLILKDWAAVQSINPFNMLLVMPAGEELPICEKRCNCRRQLWTFLLMGFLLMGHIFFM